MTDTDPQPPVTMPEDMGEKLHEKLLKVNEPLVIVGIEAITLADAVAIPTTARNDAKMGVKGASF